MRVALCQMRSGEDVESNVATAERMLNQAADGGADIAALPETFTYLGSRASRRAAAEPVPGPTTAWPQVPAGSSGPNTCGTTWDQSRSESMIDSRSQQYSPVAGDQ